MTYFIARTEGEVARMRVMTTSRIGKVPVDKEEEHFGYIFQDEFYYECGSKYFIQPLSKCTRIQED